jgi:hypothetical protein
VRTTFETEVYVQPVVENGAPHLRQRFMPFKLAARDDPEGEAARMNFSGVSREQIRGMHLPRRRVKLFMGKAESQLLQDPL